jgi:hypothetical protein
MVELTQEEKDFIDSLMEEMEEEEEDFDEDPLEEDLMEGE